MGKKSKRSKTGARTARHAPEESTAMADATPALTYDDSDALELTGVGPGAGAAMTSPLEAEQAAAASSSRPWYLSPGVAVAVLMAIGAVWSFTLIPWYVVGDLRRDPRNTDALFQVVHCAMQAQTTRVTVSTAHQGVRTSTAGLADDWAHLQHTIDADTAALRRCLEDAADLSDDVSDVASYGSALSTARSALESSPPDIRAAANALQTLLGSMVDSVMAELPDDTLALWAPSLRLLLQTSRRAYDAATANVGRARSVVSASETSSVFARGSAIVDRAGYTTSVGPQSARSVLGGWYSQQQAAVNTMVASLRLADSASALYADVDRLPEQAQLAVEKLLDLKEDARQELRERRTVLITNLAVSCVAFAIVCLVCVSTAVMVLRITKHDAQVEAYRRVLRADFTVDLAHAHAPPKAESLQSLSLLCAKCSVMDTTDDEAVDLDPRQLMVHLLKAKPTLSALRSFAPEHAFERHQTFECFNRTMQRAHMTTGLTSDNNCSIVVVGLRSFSRTLSADLEQMARLLFLLQEAVLQHGGVLAQITPTHALVVFDGKDTIDGMEGSASQRHPGQGPAARAVQLAFRMLAIGAELQHEGFSGLHSSISVASGCALHGPVTTHSTRVYALASYILPTGLLLEHMTAHLGACILCDATTAEAVEEQIITRPVALCPPRQTTVHEVVMPNHGPNDGKDPPNPEVSAYAARIQRWKQAFEKYEEAVTSVVPDKVEEAYMDLHNYKQFAQATLRQGEVAEDKVYQQLSDHLRRLMNDLGVKF